MGQSAPRPGVLIAEDKALARLATAEFLLDQGLQILEAKNAEKALAVLSRRPAIGLLFTDINRTGRMDSLGLAREVHRDWPLMLLMLTSNRAQLSSGEMPDHREFVAKPYYLDKLADRIQEVLKR